MYAGVPSGLDGHSEVTAGASLLGLCSSNIVAAGKALREGKSVQEYEKHLLASSQNFQEMVTSLDKLLPQTLKKHSLDGQEVTIPAGSSMSIFRNWGSFRLPSIGGAIQSFPELSTYLEKKIGMVPVYISGPMVGVPLVPRADKVKYLGSMISWDKPFESAFQHRLGVSETSYKKLRLVWNSSMTRARKVKIFQATFLPSLIYGLDALTLTDKDDLRRIDAQYYRFLRRAIGIKASYYSRVSNEDVWAQAGRPQRPSELLYALQHKMLQEVFASSMDNPLHNVVFATAYKDRILAPAEEECSSRTG